MDVEDLRTPPSPRDHRLPARLREPILLCYLDGRTNDEAARLIGCPTSTLKERLARGRELLGSRLARRGLTLSTLLLLLLLPNQCPAETVPPWLVLETVRAVRRRRNWTRNLDNPDGSSGPPRLLLIAITATTVLALGSALALATPTPRQGSWLAWVVEVEPARTACH